MSSSNVRSGHLVHCGCETPQLVEIVDKQLGVQYLLDREALISIFCLLFAPSLAQPFVGCVFVEPEGEYRICQATMQRGPKAALPPIASI